MSIDLANCSLTELWLYVSSHLSKRGIPTVLVGGSVVTVYTQGAYVSGDLDFVPPLLTRAHEIKAVMAELGFSKDHHRSYTHPACARFFIDFVSPPLSIGNEMGIIPAERKAGEVQVMLLTATDCIKDRLAGYIYFQAAECLEQAVLVAQRQKIDLSSIEAWCQAEKASWAYADFLAAIELKPLP